MKNDRTSGCKSCGKTIERKGEALGSFLNGIIDGMSADRADIVDDIASAAGITVSTVNQILNGSIECPPIGRLEDFAGVLSTSLGRIQSAAEEDGCEYDEGASAGGRRPSRLKSDKTMEMMVGDFEVKAIDRKKRTFEGDLSTSHLDLGNGWEQDIVWPGAFKNTIDHFNNAEDPYIPLLDSHDTWSIFSVFGHATELEEKLTGENLTYDLEDGGKLVVPEMNLRTKWSVIDGADGDRVLDRLRPGSVRKMSMGYRPQTWDQQTLADGGMVRNLREVALREGSLVVFGMNPEAEVDLGTVKSFLRRFKKDITDTEREELFRVHDRLGALLQATASVEEADVPGAASDEVRAVLDNRIQKLLADSLVTRISAVRRSSASVIT